MSSSASDLSKAHSAAALGTRHDVRLGRVLRLAQCQLRAGHGWADAYMKWGLGAGLELGLWLQLGLRLGRGLGLGITP